MDGLKKFKITVWFQAIAAPVRLLLMLVFMPFRALSGYVVGQCAMPLVYIVGSLVSLRKFLKSPISPVPYWKEHGREMLSYTWPLVVSAIIGAIAGNMDTLVIRHRLCEFESAGYYILTRFSDMSIWMGAAFTCFLTPMLAGKNGDDSNARKLLLHSICGTAIMGGLVSLGLLFVSERILGLKGEWVVYCPLSRQMSLLAFNGMLGMVANCVVAAFTARGRFGFFLYYLPLCLLKSVALYALTGYTFFAGILPPSWLDEVAAFNPCRLIVVVGFQTITQVAIDAVLLVHAFAVKIRE